MLQYQLKFGLTPGANGPASLLVTGLWINTSHTMPKPEILQHHDRAVTALRTGGWKISYTTDGIEAQRGQLRASLKTGDEHPMDIKSGRQLPGGYGHMDIQIWKDGDRPDPDYEYLLWHAFNKGIRQKDQRGNPTRDDDLRLLSQRLPFQLEVGAGLSIEAGIPALHNLHQLYCVTDMTDRSYIFDAERDDLIDLLLSDPERQIKRMSEMKRSVVIAQPTPMHNQLADMQRQGIMVGQPITNNFDGLLRRAGLGEEQYVRRYDDYIPPVDFDPAARSLLVIGSHADRRRVQERARAAGLDVFYMDPEGFFDQDKGVFRVYPLESPQDPDFLARVPAREGIPALARQLDLPDAGSTIMSVG